MASRICPKCSTASETSADTCPACGASYMRRGVSAPQLVMAVAAVCIVAVVAIIAVSGGDDEPSTPTANGPAASSTPTPTSTALPEGVITNTTARSVPLNTTRAQLEKMIGVAPVDEYPVNAPPQTVDVRKFGGKRSSVARLERQFGKAKNGIVEIPARRFDCLAWRGLKNAYGWEFCLYEDKLEYVRTREPLPVS